MSPLFKLSVAIILGLALIGWVTLYLFTASLEAFR